MHELFFRHVALIRFKVYFCMWNKLFFEYANSQVQPGGKVYFCRCFIPQTFSRSLIKLVDDRLQVSVAEPVEVITCCTCIVHSRIKKSRRVISAGLVFFLLIQLKMLCLTRSCSSACLASFQRSRLPTRYFLDCFLPRRADTFSLSISIDNIITEHVRTFLFKFCPDAFDFLIKFCGKPTGGGSL